MGGDLVTSLGGRKKYFGRKKCAFILTSKIFDDFLVIGRLFMLHNMLDNIIFTIERGIAETDKRQTADYMTFLAEKPLFQSKTSLFFSRFVPCHPSNNTTSRNIGEMDAWAVSHLIFLGTVP